MGSTSSLSVAPALNAYSQDLDDITDNEIARISQQIVSISVMSVPVSIGIGKHHFIQAKNHRSPYYYWFEWGESLNFAHRTKHPGRAKVCIKNIFEDITLSELFEAYVSASEGKSYSLMEFNCNHWTEAVIAQLGKRIEVSWDCSCKTR